MYLKRIILLGLAIVLFLTGCQSNSSSSAKTNDNSKVEDYVYTKYNLEVENKVKLGNENAGIRLC